MSDGLVTVFEVILYALIALVVARSLISWFPLKPDNQIVRFVYRASEPMLAPFRRIIPSAGMIDFSGMAVVFLLIMMITAVRRTAS